MPVDAKELLKHADFLRALVRGLVLDQNRVDDVVQETYLRALDRPPAHARNVRGWLATVARNLAFRLQRDATRRARREERAGRPDRQPPAGDVAARVEIQRRIAEAVDALDEPYRAAIVYRYLDGLAPREIAARLGVPIKTVKTRLHRGLERLRGQLDRRYGDRNYWSLAVLPLVVPKGGGAVATGVAFLTMKKIAAALLVLCVALFWTVSKTRSDPSTAPSRSGSRHTAENVVPTDPPADETAPGSPAEDTRNSFVFPRTTPTSTAAVSFSAVSASAPRIRTRLPTRTATSVSNARTHRSRSFALTPRATAHSSPDRTNPGARSNSCCRATVACT
jgi:RNA polymerase sigma-70 factor (ECF subfamily)